MFGLWERRIRATVAVVACSHTRQSSHIIQKDHLLHRCKEEKGGHAQKTVCVPPLQDVQNNDDAK